MSNFNDAYRALALKISKSKQALLEEVELLQKEAEQQPPALRYEALAHVNSLRYELSSPYSRR